MGYKQRASYFRPTPSLFISQQTANDDHDAADHKDHDIVDHNNDNHNCDDEGKWQSINYLLLNSQQTGNDDHDDADHCFMNHNKDDYEDDDNRPIIAICLLSICLLSI